ncbi:holo-ACP synthase [Thorsellia anophelis]|uniref:Holo-[acyl-carrier-protein] synthase n=1 Tax=Thorsellia anophelis DSM 18579 TaxID=1123402 RepID=A0A1H9ZEL0_9GAMM|nr:holo-ACP synthase [Thorsellia anophelis]SES80014.1 holo-[acyl-carrier protein] synthase [Thorsellia anophelis DSM 18579]
MAIIGLGTDIVEIKRIERIVSSLGDKLAKRILTQDEFLAYCKHKQPIKYLAKRFATKEAAAKALGLGFRDGLAFNQFGTQYDTSGKPILVLYGKAKEIADSLQIQSSHLSISDETHYAVAVVIFER